MAIKNRAIEHDALKQAREMFFFFYHKIPTKILLHFSPVFPSLYVQESYGFFA